MSKGDHDWERGRRERLTDNLSMAICARCGLKRFREDVGRTARGNYKVVCTYETADGSRQTTRPPCPGSGAPVAIPIEPATTDVLIEATPVDVLIELGRTLHGEYWVGPTARDLDVRLDTVTKWASGKRSPPGPILDALRLLVKSHTQAVARAREISGKAT